VINTDKNFVFLLVEERVVEEMPACALCQYCDVALRFAAYIQLPLRRTL